MEEDILVADVEFKFAQDGATGTFSGYASVFNHQDAHGDVVKPGAFVDTLAERKAAGRTLPMHVMHGIFGGDGIPVGVWQNVAEDDKGLAVEGKISGMNTEAGRLLYERVKDGALGGLSIGYSVKPGGSKLGKGAGEPKRTITAVKLHEISLVDDPSNALSRVQEMKAAAVARASTFTADAGKAALSVANAIKMHDGYMDDRSYPSAKDKALLMSHLMDAHECLTGSRIPDGVSGWKNAPITVSELEAFLREKGISPTDATQLAERGFKSLFQGGAVKQASITADLAGFDLAGFSLPKF